MKNRFAIAVSMLAACWLWPAAASADQLNAADTAWILTASGLVLFMTVPGLALFYGGLVRTKNVLSILMQCFAITSLVSVLWLFGGYSLALTDGEGWNAVLGGLSRLTFGDMNAETVKDNLPETVFCMYHLTFAIFAPALIVGGVAERMKFSSLLWFVALWEVLIYVPVCHWVWGGGWLAQLGVPESRYFCRKIFSGILLEKIGKNHATAYAFGAPIRPRHLVPTQQGVGTLVLA